MFPNAIISVSIRENQKWFFDTLGSLAFNHNAFMCLNEDFIMGLIRGLDRTELNIRNMN